VSRKSERLVNLTIALLATERWVTKTEIYRTVDGYAGELDAKERMFERDKGELRNLGIEIEVGSFDPLFEDEVGYRIRADKYQLHLKDLSPTQLALIARATQAWHGAVLSSQASSGLAKLQSLGIESDVDGMPALANTLRISDNNLVKIIDAISQKRTISFGYRNLENAVEQRALEPFGVGTKNGHWYLAGQDLGKRDIRLFRLDRIDADVKEQGKATSFSIPADFSMRKILASKVRDKKALIAIRTNRGHKLRQHGTVISSDTEWDQVEIMYSDTSELLTDVMWHRDDAKIINPREAIDALLKALVEIELRHV
jgi:proteasome accessory factor B